MSLSVEQSQVAAALRRLSELATLTHFRTGAVVETLFGGSPGSAGRRAILRNLLTLGPLTVPRLAALRPVSRQYIQSLVDELKAAGLVELMDNPQHKRSRLVGLSPAGRTAVADADAREAPVLAQAAAAVGASFGQIEAAADLLARLLAHMDEILLEQAADDAA